MTKTEATTSRGDPLAGDAHQAGVALVQRAHGRHEADRPAAARVPGEQRVQLLAGVRRATGRVVIGPRARSGRRSGRVEQLEDPAGADRQHPAVGDGPVEGGAGQGDVGRHRLRRVGLQVLEVRPHGADVTADDRAGQRGVAVVEGVVEGGGQQRPQRGGRVVDAGGGEDLHGLGDQGDQVVGAVREAGVVERAHLLGHPRRAAAEVGDERLGDGRARRARR